MSSPKKHHYSQHIIVTKIKNSETIKTSFRQIKASGKESQQNPFMGLLLGFRLNTCFVAEQCSTQSYHVWLFLRKDTFWPAVDQTPCNSEKSQKWGQLYGQWVYHISHPNICIKHDCPWAKAIREGIWGSEMWWVLKLSLKTMWYTRCWPKKR